MSPSYINTILTLAATLLGSATAAPAISKQQPAPGSAIQSFLINYDFETFSTTTGQLPVTNKPVNDYNLLQFANTLLVNQTSNQVLGVPCHTEPACAAFSGNTQLLSSILTPGQQGSTTALGPAFITAAYQYSPISYFDPYAFYFGCAGNSIEDVASVPLSCNVTATGVNSAGKTVYSQMFEFNVPVGALNQPMELAYFDNGWYGLQVQTLYLSVTNNLTTAALFDNFLATVYGPQNAAILVDFLSS